MQKIALQPGANALLRFIQRGGFLRAWHDINSRILFFGQTAHFELYFRLFAANIA